MSTGDYWATLLNQLRLNNSSAANASKNKEVKPSQFPAPIMNPNLVAYQAFGPIGPSYFAPPSPMYGPAPTYIQAQAGVPSGQATILPHAFTIGSIHDLTTGAWNMDTGASSHFNDSVTNLSEVSNSYGTLSRYKARLVANGSTQLEGVDVDETFSPVVKSGTIRTVLSLAASRHWPIHQLDVKNAFLHDLFMGSSRLLELGFGRFESYITRGTLNYGLQLFSSSTTDLVAYSDADWAGCPTTRRSTSGYCVFLGNNLLSWSAKRQPTLSRSSAEAKYRGIANDVAKTCWLRNLLPAGQVRVLHVPSRYQFVDIFTKGLSSALFGSSHQFERPVSSRFNCGGVVSP
ncbi:ribonuclease H-like domain-containing protein [Tanacetum coccineum]